MGSGEYTVEQLDGEIIVNHPRYTKLTTQKGKIREKISRREAKLYKLIDQNIDGELEENKKNEARQQKIHIEIEELLQEEKKILAEREKYPSKIKIKDMEDQIRYNQLNGESKHFQNILKMICYRAESAFANLLAPHYKKSINQKRALTKIINTPIDLRPDYQANKLYVTLYTLPTPRDNETIDEIIETLNDSKTKYPGTDLVLCYETTTSQFA